MRKRISLRVKLDAVLYAEKNSVSATARAFNVDPKQIRDWRKQKRQLECLIRSGSGSERNRLAGGGSKIVSSEMEMELYKWIMDRKREGVELSQKETCEKAKEIFASLENVGRQTFRASKGWYEKFIQRNGFSENSKSSNDVCGKLLSFVMSVSQARQNYSIDNSNIIAMDEVSISFDMPINLPSLTEEDNNNLISSNVTTCEDELVENTNQITIVLAASGDGKKLKPFIVFKDGGHTISESDLQNMITLDSIPSDQVMVTSSPDGWMNTELTTTWIREICAKCTFDNSAKKLLVWDSYQCHLSSEVKDVLDEHNTCIEIIPGGCSKYIQASNLYWSKPFKEKVIEHFDTWMEQGENKDYTAGQVLKSPSIRLVTTWILNAWNSLPDDMILQSFLCVGLTNALDGSEDNEIICFKEGQPCRFGWQRLQNLRYAFGQDNNLLKQVIMDTATTTDEIMNETNEELNELENSNDNNNMETKIENNIESDIANMENDPNISSPLINNNDINEINIENI